MMPVGLAHTTAFIPALTGNCQGWLSKPQSFQPILGKIENQGARTAAKAPNDPGRACREGRGNQGPYSSLRGEPAAGYEFHSRSHGLHKSRKPSARTPSPAMLSSPLWSSNSQRMCHSNPAPSRPALEGWWPRQPPPSHHPPAFVMSEPGWARLHRDPSREGYCGSEFLW